MAKRKPKKGYVYLLQSSSNTNLFKFGCTTLTPEKRCKKVNQDNPSAFFGVISCFKSFDIFSDENNIKHGLLPGGAGLLGEIFDISDCDDFKNGTDVMQKFLMVAGVIK